VFQTNRPRAHGSLHSLGSISSRCRFFESPTAIYEKEDLLLRLQCRGRRLLPPPEEWLSGPAPSFSVVPFVQTIPERAPRDVLPWSSSVLGQVALFTSPWARQCLRPFPPRVFCKGFCFLQRTASPVLALYPVTRLSARVRFGEFPFAFFFPSCFKVSILFAACRFPSALLVRAFHARVTLVEMRVCRKTPLYVVILSLVGWFLRGYDLRGVALWGAPSHFLPNRAPARPPFAKKSVFF